MLWNDYDMGYYWGYGVSSNLIRLMSLSYTFNNKPIGLYKLQIEVQDLFNNQNSTKTFNINLVD